MGHSLNSPRLRTRPGSLSARDASWHLNVMTCRVAERWIARKTEITCRKAPPSRRLSGFAMPAADWVLPAPQLSLRDNARNRKELLKSVQAPSHLSNSDLLEGKAISYTACEPVRKVLQCIESIVNLFVPPDPEGGVTCEIAVSACVGGLG